MALIVVPIVACWVVQCALRVCHERGEEARTRECFGTGHSTHRYEGGGCGGRHGIRTATTVCGCRACGARCAEPICSAQCVAVSPHPDTALRRTRMPACVATTPASAAIKRMCREARDCVSAPARSAHRAASVRATVGPHAGARNWWRRGGAWPHTPHYLLCKRTECNAETCGARATRIVFVFIVHCGGRTTRYW